ncbi:putative AAA domain-containing protein YrvN [Virgibacillus pantothenticus]|uniref:Replication-associated recombination protein A n=1 Tax=Virgibacillus pantothenticus TaxID=1473 RepID=A0A0L0QPW6_VIRPA|nr:MULTISPECIES: replication-associated recombination protein A [Virgibacillus]API90637.1 recombinase RarA [Virgibacillus sp. 6R]KNE20591.1 recombinase RarA [Virgibacillus pantothenticus]MBS7429756.1 replication-associated recombination protein A [Virgibacillus sp. 19R1-5]MBU8565631.1 replication-associated recombination protein A [Virgibacillus pantothenticus]MBU8601287.1 replication-associated recombination protein A [Virgibacillus pantothenticus]
MKQKPLAFQMRPEHIDDIIGQEHLVGEGKIIRRMVAAERLASMILFGPPGTGKTSMALALAKSLGKQVKTLNAVTDKKKDMEIVVEEAKMTGQIVLILDEVHRLDKAKQDFLLPHLENNLIILIGCTTSNPYHSINPAIRSRCHLFELHKLTSDHVKEAIKRAMTDEAKGYGKKSIQLSDEALDHFAISANGDLRAALNGFELAVSSTPENEENHISITLTIAEECMQKKSFSHDKNGDAHYDVLSAFQKSIRGSDVDASLHYLARLVEAGDLDSIARRMIVTAYEDIGLANPQAGPRALAAVQAAERLGFPEARIPLAVAIIELCLSPKSNTAYKALDKALHDVRSGKGGEVPAHIKDAHYAGAKLLGRGTQYQYPHDYDHGWVKQQYLPDAIKHKQYYEPKATGKFEQAMKQVYEKIRKDKQN